MEGHSKISEPTYPSREKHLFVAVEQTDWFMIHTDIARLIIAETG